MSQHDFDIATADANTGTTIRAEINAALQALASNNSGSAAPTVTYSNMIWVDTSGSVPVWYIRDASNTSWHRMFNYKQAVVVGPFMSAGDTPYSVLATDETILVQTLAYTNKITLPALSAAQHGRVITVICRGTVSSGVTVQRGAGTDKIEGAASDYSMAINTSKTFHAVYPTNDPYNKKGWYVI